MDKPPDNSEREKKKGWNESQQIRKFFSQVRVIEILVQDQWDKRESRNVSHFGGGDKYGF